MHIGVDATCWQNRRGYGRHARALLTALVSTDSVNQYTFCVDSAEQADSIPSAAKVKLVPAAVPTTRAATYDGHRSVRDMWQMSRALAEPAFDLLLFPTIYSYVPVFSPAKKIVGILDTIAESFPQWTQPSRTGQLFWKAKTAAGRWQADMVITLSDYSRRGIIERFHLPPSRVAIVSAAADPTFRILQDPQPTPHMCELGLERGRQIVYLGGFSPHKNLKTLVDAFAAIARRPETQDVKLVLVGEYANESFYGEFETIEAQVQTYGLQDRVVCPGFMPDEELVVLLNRAELFCLPSWMEGFGLPAVEAAACGCPIIVTEASPLPALFGEGALHFDPHDVEGLTSALFRVLTDQELKLRLRTQGPAAAARLTWDAAALQLLHVLSRFN